MTVNPMVEKLISLEEKVDRNDVNNQEALRNLEDRLNTRFDQLLAIFQKLDQEFVVVRYDVGKIKTHLNIQ